MSTSYEKALPAEKWQQVLVNVPPVHLCNVVGTSSYMYSVASWPDLWADMEVNAEKVREDGLSQLYTINRFTKVRKIDFSRKLFTSAELERVLGDIPGSPLENINLNHVNLSEVEAELLAKAVSHLKTVDLSYTDLTTNQCVKVLEASLSSTTLVSLKLGRVNLSQVPAKLLAKAVSRLQTVMLLNTRLTTDQCIEMLEAILSSTTLVNVDLLAVNLSQVPAELLARAVSHLHTVILMNTQLTTDQSVEILEAILSSTTLVNVDLCGINLSQVPAELLARAVSHLQTVSLSSTKLTTNQCVTVLEDSLSSITLVNLDLGYVKLGNVSAELLANSVSHLQIVDLNNTHLTTDQCVKILEAILSSTTLANIDMHDVNLSEVPAELLARAISHLQTVNLCATKLTTYQCVKVLEASLTSTTLVKVYLVNVNLSEVPAELLAMAVSRLQTVYLNNTKLTTDHCVKVLGASLSSTTLVNLYLADVNLSEVPAELLAMAVSGSHLQTVDLCSTELTTDQSVKVIEASLSSSTFVNVKLGGVCLSDVPDELYSRAFKYKRVEGYQMG